MRSRVEAAAARYCDVLDQWEVAERTGVTDPGAPESSRQMARMLQRRVAEALRDLREEVLRG